MNSVLPANCTPMPAYNIDAALVSRLIAEQHPDLEALPLWEIEAGWDKAIFRLGDRLAVRLPRRAAAARLITNEQRWLPTLAKLLSLPVPEPYRVGKPALGYPCSWSIVPWLKGASADICEPDRTQAVAFAKFLRALHVPAPEDAPTNPVRGVPLRERSTAIEARFERLMSKTDLITRGVREAWQNALAAPPDGERCGYTGICTLETCWLREERSAE